ncbi:hypothetical protein F4802DRAFT_366374 [Xylaria palmicola]|nr:hypothetical protein F4802DRAFT_366374 [Xylaria palmicola]
MSDAYLRTGRGGAGNFYSQKDVEDAATKDRAEDPEAQKPPAHLDDNSTAPSASAGTNTVSSATPGAYARSGRGGAGNFVSPSSLPPTTTTSAPPSAPPPSGTPRPKYSGRGGAGNWAGADGDLSDGARRAGDDQDRRRKEALDAGIAEEIRAALPLPRRTYHLHEPGRGRRPEGDAADPQQGGA